MAQLTVNRTARFQTQSVPDLASLFHAGADLFHQPPRRVRDQILHIFGPTLRRQTIDDHRVVAFLTPARVRQRRHVFLQHSQ